MSEFFQGKSNLSRWRDVSFYTFYTMISVLYEIHEQLKML